MSDSNISIVPKIFPYPNKHEKVKEILEWLMAENIIETTLSDCLLGASNGYAISIGAKNITNFPAELPFDLITNGLEIISSKQVFHTGEHGIDELICPQCNEDIVFEEWDLEPWVQNESIGITCPNCGSTSSIYDFIFEPEWGFSDLGFTFWNWPENINDDFIEAFKVKLGCEIAVVYQHL